MGPLLKVVKKKKCVSEIWSQEQEPTKWFADQSLFYDQTQIKRTSKTNSSKML